ncbi:MAG: ribbon-helix-helix protein, CopG family [Deltaproteobacteria bacterium]|nr:ribbon-helix-helix protein, CopG family [Deltaproteobacteria bacterium]
MVTISIDDKLAKELEALAKDLGKSVDKLAGELLKGTLSDKKTEAKIARARADVAAGRVVDNDKMVAWLRSWGTKDETEPPPCE